MYRSKGEALGVQKLNSADADSETSRRPPADEVLHRAGCARVNDQLLREGWRRHDSCPRHDPCHALRPGLLDENNSTSVDGGDASHGLMNCCKSCTLSTPVAGQSTRAAYQHRKWVLRRLLMRLSSFVAYPD